MKGLSQKVSLEEFNCKMEKLIWDCYETVRDGGYIALCSSRTPQSLAMTLLQQEGPT